MYRGTNYKPDTCTKPEPDTNTDRCTITDTNTVADICPNPKPNRAADLRGLSNTRST